MYIYSVQLYQLKHNQEVKISIDQVLWKQEFRVKLVFEEPRVIELHFCTKQYA